MKLKNIIFIVLIISQVIVGYALFAWSRTDFASVPLYVSIPVVLFPFLGDYLYLRSTMITNKTKRIWLAAVSLIIALPVLGHLIIMLIIELILRTFFNIPKSL